MSERILEEPIELTDAELDAVSGGRGSEEHPEDFDKDEFHKRKV